MSCLYHSRKCISKCYFCGEDHTCRECPLEAQMAPILKKKVGIMMEHYVANNFVCPNCSSSTLKVIGNHSPSLDIICSECSKKIEVKSKCLSANKLPKDIRLPHGSYPDYINRLDNGLDLFVVIYGVDRIKKLIKIREVLHATNIHLRNPNIVEVIKRQDSSTSNLSTIFIKDKDKLNLLQVPQKDKFIDFSDEITKFLEHSKGCEVTP